MLVRLAVPLRDRARGKEVVATVVRCLQRARRAAAEVQHECVERLLRRVLEDRGQLTGLLIGEDAADQLDLDLTLAGVGEEPELGVGC